MAPPANPFWQYSHPAILKVPQEVLTRILKFCHHFSLLPLYHTHRDLRKSVLKEMHTRIHTLDFPEKSLVGPPDVVFNIWTALTWSTSCTFCGGCNLSQKIECKDHPLFKRVICKACFMERIHAERPQTGMDENGNSIVEAKSGIIWRLDKSEVSESEDDAFSCLSAQCRIKGYFEMMELLWKFAHPQGL